MHFFCDPTLEVVLFLFVFVVSVAFPVVEEGDGAAGVAQLAGTLQHLALVRILRKKHILK